MTNENDWCLSNITFQVVSIPNIPVFHHQLSFEINIHIFNHLPGLSYSQLQWKFISCRWKNLKLKYKYYTITWLCLLATRNNAVIQKNRNFFSICSRIFLLFSSKCRYSWNIWCYGFRKILSHISFGKLCQISFNAADTIKTTFKRKWSIVTINWLAGSVNVYKLRNAFRDCHQWDINNVQLSQ